MMRDTKIYLMSPRKVVGGNSGPYYPVDGLVDAGEAAPNGDPNIMKKWEGSNAFPHPSSWSSERSATLHSREIFGIVKVGISTSTGTIAKSGEFEMAFELV